MTRLKSLPTAWPAPEDFGGKRRPNGAGHADPERAEPSQAPRPSPSGPGACGPCGGTGWLQVPDPFLGDWIDARCPDCEPRP